MRPEGSGAIGEDPQVHAVAGKPGILVYLSVWNAVGHGLRLLRGREEGVRRNGRAGRRVLDRNALCLYFIRGWKVRRGDWVFGSLLPEREMDVVLDDATLATLLVPRAGGWGVVQAWRAVHSCMSRGRGS